MLADETKCVDCQRCVCLCPARALKIVESGNTFRRDENWTAPAISGGLPAGGQRAGYCSPRWEAGNIPSTGTRMLINASQVTNLPIDPLREPMETRTFPARSPEDRADEKGGSKQPRPQLSWRCRLCFPR
ncbi:MAG: hypothetical protein ACLVL7_10475 [Anaerotruncus massiliensis (ex Togo et al. 2019)]